MKAQTFSEGTLTGLADRIFFILQILTGFPPEIWVGKPKYDPTTCTFQAYGRHPSAFHSVFPLKFTVTRLRHARVEQSALKQCFTDMAAKYQVPTLAMAFEDFAPTLFFCLFHK